LQDLSLPTISEEDVLSEAYLIRRPHGGNRAGANEPRVRVDTQRREDGSKCKIPKFTDSASVYTRCVKHTGIAVTS